LVYGGFAHPPIYEVHVNIKNMLVCLVILIGGTPTNAQWGQTHEPGGYIIDGWHHRPGCPCQVCSHLRSQARPPTKIQPPPKTKAEKSEPPPAPKDPDDDKPTRSPVAAVKADTETSAAGSKDEKKDSSKADVVKSISENPHIPATVKREILAGLMKKEGTVEKDEPRIDPTPGRNGPSPPHMDFITPGLIPSLAKTNRISHDGFDLLEALKRNAQPAVKTDTDEAQPFKPAAPPAGDKKTPPPPPVQADTTDKYEIPETEIGVTVGAKIDYTTPWDATKAVPYGKLVQFWVKPSTKKPDKLKSVAYTWTVLPKEEVLLWPDTTRVIFSTSTKRQNYVVMLTASYVFLDGEQIVQRATQTISMIQVGEGGQTVNPVAPPTLTGLSKQAYEWIGTIARTDNYDDSKMKMDARRLAAVFTAIADRIDKAQLTDVGEIIAASKVENDKAIAPDSRNNWLPWFSRMTDMLKAAYRDNAIRTPQQYAAAWKEIAVGLEAASK
jgi:hypothetical protein